MTTSHRLSCALILAVTSPLWLCAAVALLVSFFWWELAVWAVTWRDEG